MSGDPFGWIGNTIEGRVRVESVAGEGAFGVVYRCRHLGFDEPVAVKCLKIPATLDEEQRARFLAAFHAEARLLLRLSKLTTGIVQPLDTGAAVAPRGAWTPYIVMEWLEGQTLEDWLAARRAAGSGPPSLAEAMALLGPVAAAVDLGHGQGVFHRDIKPANIFLARAGAATVTKVLDFGIAKVLQDASVTSALQTTGASLRAFTPQYGAPEQFSDRYGATGPWTDVFATALVLVELATLKPALSGADPIQLYVSACDVADRPSLASRGVGAPYAVEAVLSRALAVDPARRYARVGEMWSELEAACRSASVATVLAGEAAPSKLPGPPRTGGVRVVAASGSAGLAPSASAPDENRLCTIVVVDLSGFTALSDRLDAEHVKEIIDRCVSAITERIDRLGGWVDKFVGDSVMAIFGVPHAADNDAERAVVAAFEAQRVLAGVAASERALRQQVPAPRIGVDTGRVFAGRIGGSTRRDFTVVGDAVNTASRLQHEGPAGAVLIGRDTYRQVVGLFDIEPVAPIAVRGKSEPLVAYRVVGPATSRPRTPPSDFYGLATRFVGRASEMRRIAEELETALDEPMARLLTLTGAPGVGRSRILTEIARELESRAQPCVLLTAQSSQMTQHSSYRLAASLLRGRFHMHEDDPPETVIKKLRRGLSLAAAVGPSPTPALGSESGPVTRDPELENVLAEVAALLGAQMASTTPVDSLAPDEAWSQAKNRIAAAFARLLGAAARNLPVVILCDDAQWADDASLDLLGEMVVRLSELPIFIVCSARPDLFERRPRWGEGDPAHERLTVGPLPRRHVEEMIRDRLQRVADVPDELVKRLVERAEGNPLTLVESLHLLVDGGVVERSDAGAWQLHAPRASSLGLPATIQGIVQARLDRLPADVRAALAQAAVVGRVFWSGALEELRAESGTAGASLVPLEGGTQAPSSLDELVAALRERQLVRERDGSMFPGEREFVFAEAATLEVAYETLSAKVRRRLHRRTAAWLARRAPGAASAAQIGLHYDKGGDFSAAVVELSRAAVHAAALGQNAEALRHYERVRNIHDDHASGPEGDASEARAWTGERDDRRIASWQDRTRLRLELGDVLHRVGRTDEGDAAYEQARAQIGTRERREGSRLDPREVARWQARIDFRAALSCKVRGDVAAARALAERSIARATQAGAEEETPVMWATLAALHRRERDLDACRAAALRGLRVCKASRQRDDRWREAVSRLLTTLGGVFFFRKRMVRAERCYRQAARAASERTHPEAVSLALNDLAALKITTGDPAGAIEALRPALALRERLGDLRAVAVALCNLAEAELELGLLQPALEHARRSARLAEQVQARGDLPEIYRNLAVALLQTGDAASALAVGERALGAATGGAGVYLDDVAVALAKIAGAVADSSAAAEVRRRALEVRDALAARLEQGEISRRGDELRTLLGPHVVRPAT